MIKKRKIKLAIASGKGGVGKSMLSSCLAMLFQKKLQVTAIDCDVDAPNLAIWLNEMNKTKRFKSFKISTSSKPYIDYKKCNGCGICVEKCRFKALKMIKNKPVLIPFLCEGCGLCQTICPQKAIKLKPVKNGEIKIKLTKYNFPLVSGALSPGETGSGKIVSEVKKQANKFDYDIQIIDSSPGTGCPVMAALQDVNFVVLVTEPTPSGFSDLKRVLQVVNHFKIPWGLVINKWDININLTNKIKKYAGKKFLGKISYDKQIFKAISDLTPILETNLNAKKEIIQIFNKLNKILCPDQ